MNDQLQSLIIDEQELVALFPDQRAAHINYSDKPLPLNDDIQLLPINAFEQLVAKHRDIPSFHYTETLMVPKKFIEKIDTSNLLKFSIPDSLVICDMGETGMGVFTQEFIQEGTIVFAYAGLAISDHYDDPYSLYLIDYDEYKILDKLLKTEVDKRPTLNPLCTSKNIGGIAGFTQSLTHVDRLQDNRGIIVTQNLAPCTVNLKYGTVQEIRICYFRALRDILPDEQIGMDYGEYYFSSRGIKPLLFTHEGHAMPEEMVCYSDELFGMLECALYENNINYVSSILSATHPSILTHLGDNEMARLQKMLPTLISLDFLIVDERIEQIASPYLDLSAMAMLKKSV